MIKRVERSDGTRYQVYGRKAGKKVYVGTYPTRKVAERFEREHQVLQDRIAAGELPPEVDPKRTLRIASDAWLVEITKRGARSSDVYREFMEKQIWPWLGSRMIADIRKKDIMAWRDDCVQRYAPNTVNSALGCLSSAFEFFKDKEWCEVNPCRGVERVEVKDRAYVWIRTVPEIERLLLECIGEMRDMVAMALGTGMRIDEILHLQWDDVDLDRRLLTVQRGRKGTPKGGMRHVPILDPVLPMLQARALRRDGRRHVFPSPRGGVRTKAPVTVAFKEAAARAELDPKLRFHDLRHTMASHWVMNGGDIFRLSKVLGHKTVLVTQRTYAHLAPEIWSQDYGRVTFSLPAEAKVIRLRRETAR